MIEMTREEQEAKFILKIEEWRALIGAAETDIEAQAAIAKEMSVAMGGRRDIEVKYFPSPLACEKAYKQDSGDTSSERHGYTNTWWAAWAAYYEFAKELGCEMPEEDYQRFVEYNKHMCYCIATEDAWYVSAKPKLKWATLADGRTVLHAEAERAVEFSDGFGWYSVDGVEVPDYMGELPFSEWKAEWLIKERNAELRRVLIRRVGYEKLVKDLNAKQLDEWREYKLMEVSVPDLPVKINLLTMTCPSTGDMHCHRVAPEIRTAEEAIVKMNHGIHPDDFVWQT